MSNSDASGPRSRAPHGAAGASPPSASIAIAELRDLLSRATPGEWFVDPDERREMEWNNHICCAEGRIAFMAHDGYARQDEFDANAALIAAAKNSMAALLDAYEERERLRSAADNVLAYAAAALYALETRPETKAGLHRALYALAHAVKETSHA